MIIVADKQQPLVAEFFGGVASVVALAPEEINNKILCETQAEALICRSTIKVNAQLLEHTRIKFVGTCTIGYDHVDLEYLRRAGIGFGSAPGCNANSVGEYMVAALLKLALKYSFDLSEKTLGIIGVGNVGKEVARKARMLGLRLLFNDPPRQRAEDSGDFVSLDRLLAESDIVSLHVPLIKDGIDKTLYMADNSFFERLKPGAVVINASRGAVLRGEDLLKAKAAGKVRAYILDVFEHEPQVSAELVTQAFIATQHISGHSYDGKINGVRMILAAFARHFAIDVDFEALYKNNEYRGRIVVPDDLNGLRAVEYAVDQCYDILRDSVEFKRSPERFKELRKNYYKRYEFPHYSVVCREQQVQRLLCNLGFGGIASD